MDHKALHKRIAQRHLKRSSTNDLAWGLNQMEGAASMLKDVAAVWELRGGGVPGGAEEESLADVYGPVGKASKLIKEIAKDLTQEATKLRGLRLKQAAGNSIPLPASLRRKVNDVLSKRGLDGNGRFVKAQKGYSLAVEILQDHGIVLNEIADSFRFTRDEGRLTLDLALSQGPDEDPLPIKNSILALTFYKRGEDNFEVLAYLS